MKTSRILEAVHETALGLYEAGVMDQVTMREFDLLCLPKGGRNDSYTIPGRGIVEREELVKEVEKGKHPDFSIYERDQEKFVRAKPDSSQTNNVNRD